VRRSILLALVAALALAVGINATASAIAGDSGAQATAKKKAGKKKAAKCPAKPKAKKKAGKSLADSAAKKKGKKKAAKCKPKKKAKAKPKATPPGAFTLTDGTYGDATAFNELRVSGGGTTAVLRSELSCFLYTSQSVPLTINGNTAKASGEHDLSVAGEPAHVKWSLTVQSTLDYTLQISWDVGNGICKSEKTVNGKFGKV